MGWLSDALNPVKHIKTMTKGAKALHKGDIGRALDPAKLLSKETPMEAESRRAKAKKTLANAPMQDPMHMGTRGPTTYLGGGPNMRSYVPNSFMNSPTAQSMAPPPPQTGMAPPPMVGKMGGGAGPMPMSSPKMPMPMPQQGAPQGGVPQQAMIMALRNRGRVM